MAKIRFIDLFAGIGGTRIGFTEAADKLGYKAECVFTSEIKESAIKAYQDNFPNEIITGDITKVAIDNIPDFDFLLAGFPCQPFSYAGSRKGFADTRGTLFFQIEKIIKEKKPTGFLLENVEGLVSHDKEFPTDKIGRTLSTILNKLESLGYKTSWKVINASDVAVPQNRKRIYIIGNRKEKVDLNKITGKKAKLKDILESGLPCMDTPFTKKLLSFYKVSDLQGKSIKDKRGGTDNIHSWDIELKGSVSKEQKDLLNRLLKERRKKHWAEKKGIKWMDGMTLTLKEIQSFMYPDSLFCSVDKTKLKAMLDDLVDKGYLKYEPPKQVVSIVNDSGEKFTKREKDLNKEYGYNIVAGKLSFEITEILDNEGISPTLVAMDAEKLAVVDGNGVRRLTIREGLRLFGFPDTYILSSVSHKSAFDLLGNTVVVPVIEKVASELLKISLS